MADSDASVAGVIPLKCLHMASSFEDVGVLKHGSQVLRRYLPRVSIQGRKMKGFLCLSLGNCIALFPLHLTGVRGLHRGVDNERSTSLGGLASRTHSYSVPGLVP
jgi:hypothetical protein